VGRLFLSIVCIATAAFLTGCVTKRETPLTVVARSIQELRPVHIVYLTRPPLPTHWRVENTSSADADDLARRATAVESAFAAEAPSELKRIFEADGLFLSVTVDNAARLDMRPPSLSRYLGTRPSPRGEDVLYVYPGSSGVSCRQMGFGIMSCSAALELQTIVYQGAPRRLVWASSQTVRVEATPESAREGWANYWNELRARMVTEGIVLQGTAAPKGS
jgi:hypothetical protein